MSYVYLTLAIVSEIAATSLLKTVARFFENAFWDSCFSFVWLVFFFLSLSLKGIQPNLVYVIWSGVGLVGTTVYLFCFFHEK